MNPRSTKIISTIGYVISTLFFILYGPQLWISCQAYCNPRNNVCTNMMGIGMLWAILSFCGIWVLLVSLILDLIALHRIKTSPRPLAQRIAWLNGSSLLGILTCVIFFFLLLSDAVPASSNCIVFAIQSVILLIFIFVPPIASMWQNSR